MSVVEKGKTMVSREERNHMRHRAHTRSSLAGEKARGRRTKMNHTADFCRFSGPTPVTSNTLALI